MALLFPNQGEAIVADLLLGMGTYTAQNLYLRLYNNNYTPVDGSTEANFTEATFTGYAQIELLAASWVITPGAPTLASYAEQLWTCSVAPSPTEQVYGYWVVQKTSGLLVWAERFSDGPYPVSKIGDKIYVTPTFNIKKSGE